MIGRIPESSVAVSQQVDGRSHDAIRGIAASWASANIFPGPFTQTDNGVYDSVIRSLLRRTSAAGFSLEEVEHAIGDIGGFMARSYAEANRRWRARVEGRRPPQ